MTASNYQTMKQAGYSYVKNYGNGLHLLKNSDGNYEIFTANKNHASWGIRFKNTHLEFCHSLSKAEIVDLELSRVW